MNRQILTHYIDSYKQNFARVNRAEIYKWVAVKRFQDNWDINAPNFLDMLSASISQTGNLLKSGQYFPLRMLQHYAEQRPERLRTLFKALYNEDEDIYGRIEEFQIETKVLNHELFPGKNTYQDPRAVIVYLTLRFPERYFFYKFEMFKSFTEKLELTYRPIKGRIENVGHFNNICEIVRHELSLDQELLRLHASRLDRNCYFDENLNILTQDFIYAVSQHLDAPAVIAIHNFITPTKEETVQSTILTTRPETIDFRGRTVNFIQNGIENKRIGDLGELWVMKYEAQKLQQINKPDLIPDIKHTSKDEGDGTGFDIQSFDENGNEIFIEVKTTKGPKDSVFFVTQTELKRSIKEKENYYLYRLYNYNESNDSADLLIISGDLTNLCSTPTTYKVSLRTD